MFVFWSYRVMLKCWLDNAANRPTFKELADNIMTLIEAKDKSYTLVDTQVDLERCTNYHYMDHQSLARQRSLSTQRSVSSDDVPLIWHFIAQRSVLSDDVPLIWHFSTQKSASSDDMLLVWHFCPIFKEHHRFSKGEYLQYSCLTHFISYTFFALY